MSSSETSSPSRRKKPSSTAAAAGKYEFEITSGTASFIVHPLAHPGASIGSIRAIVMSYAAAGVRPRNPLAPGRKMHGAEPIPRSSWTARRNAMLTKEQNDLITLTDAGTPGGELMRRY